MRRLGVDMDGCLSAFNESFLALAEKRTGRQMPVCTETYPDEWGYMSKLVTREEQHGIWEEIKSTPFWFNLAPMGGCTVALERLTLMRFGGDAVYFITSRPGLYAKFMTEQWLRHQGFSMPTVLVVDSIEAKGQLAAGLDLTDFIDDRPDNCNAVRWATWQPRRDQTRTFLVNQPYNQEDTLSERVDSVMHALSIIQKEDSLAA